MALIWGKKSAPKRITSNKYPDTSGYLIVTVPPVATKGSNRRFLFNKTAQDVLQINTQSDPDTLINNEIVFSFDEEANRLYIGLYNKAAFAEVENAVGKIPTINIGKTTMGFSSKELYTGLQQQFGEHWDASKDQYFKLEVVDIEAPVVMYTFVPTNEELEVSQEGIVAVEEVNNAVMMEAPKVNTIGANANISVEAAPKEIAPTNGFVADMPF